MEMIGRKREVTVTVTPQMLASHVGSGEVDVFATPMMIALMEQAAAGCAKEFLEEGQTTVGTEMNTSHVSATPCGMKVTACAEITAWEGRSITFSVKACDEAGVIGEGTHSRVVVPKERFEQKAQAKRNGSVSGRKE